MSGAYFPLALFPEWVQSVARLNPIAIALEGMRAALLGSSLVGSAPMSALEASAAAAPS